MRRRVLAIFALCVAHTGAAEKPRLLVLTAIGGDPDDQQSLIRLMVHANEFEIEGLIASAAGTPGELKRDTVKPELIREIVEAYGKVQPNLVKHHPDFPEAKLLLDRIKIGNPKRGVENIGEGKDTEGSKWIIAAADRDDKRPLNIVIWGGSTELAQALWSVRKNRPKELAQFLRKLRVYAIGHQDNTGPWINEQFPDLFYILSKAPEGRDKREGGYRGMYLGGDESLTSREWVDRHVRKDHGPLGALYPTSTWTAPNPHGTLKEGDTPSWFYFLPVGLSSPEHPEHGCWGGRFRRVEGKRHEDDRDTINKKTEARANVYRWRPAYQNEFAARMDWCVKPVKEANHPPVAGLKAFGSDVLHNPMTLVVKAGEKFSLDAAGSSDADGNKLTYRWYVYPELSPDVGAVQIVGVDKANATFNVPPNASDSFAIVLEVTDDGSPPLTRYRRVVVSVDK
jgi:hypothetical protein